MISNISSKSFRQSTNAGFTLIELLVVIAIIGILASIVLVSIASAREKAQTARVLSDMRQLRTIGEIFATSSPGGYNLFHLCVIVPDATNCLDTSSAAEVQALVDDAGEVNGDALPVLGISNSNGFCLVSRTNPATTDTYCVNADGQTLEGVLGYCGAPVPDLIPTCLE